MRVLVVNAGSSSVKIRVLGPDDDVLFHRDLGGRTWPGPELAAALSEVRDRVDAVGHRVVHGGTRYVGPVLIDDDVDRGLRRLVDLAPLHQPASLAGIDVARRVLPDVPAVACFDTAFHATMPAAASTYAVPSSWRDRLGVRRYGFHGLSHAYVSRRCAQLVDRPLADLRIVSCHLGAGASVTAVGSGTSRDTTMGFTPLDGLVMATRSGSLDPGAVTWLVQHAGIAVDDVADTLEHRSGMLALAGTDDMADALVRSDAGDGDASLGVAVYLHRLRGAIAAMAAALGGLDVLAFTGGVGEHAPAVRSGAAAGLGFLGVRIDEDANAAAVADVAVSEIGAAVTTLVVAAREDLQIAHEVRSVLEEVFR